MTTLYGLKNCDTCKKAMKAMDDGKTTDCIGVANVNLS